MSADRRVNDGDAHTAGFNVCAEHANDAFTDRILISVSVAVIYCRRPVCRCLQEFRHIS